MLRVRQTQNGLHSPHCNNSTQNSKTLSQTYCIHAPMNRVRRVMCTMCQWRMDRCRNARLAVSTAVHGAGTLSPRDAVVSASASADGVMVAIPGLQAPAGIRQVRHLSWLGQIQSGACNAAMWTNKTTRPLFAARGNLP